MKTYIYPKDSEFTVKMSKTTQLNSKPTTSFKQLIITLSTPLFLGKTLRAVAANQINLWAIKPKQWTERMCDDANDAQWTLREADVKILVKVTASWWDLDSPSSSWQFSTTSLSPLLCFLYCIAAYLLSRHTFLPHPAFMQLCSDRFSSAPSSTATPQSDWMTAKWVWRQEQQYKIVRSAQTSSPIPKTVVNASIIKQVIERTWCDVESLFRSAEIFHFGIQSLGGLD